MSEPNSRQQLEAMVKELPPELHQEVIEYIESLLRKKPKNKYLRQDWAGGLKKYRDQYTSLELQKKAMEWQAESAMKDVSG